VGIVVRQSLKAGLGSYIGVGIGIINQMYISTKFLSVEQLSLSRLLFENSLLFSAFAHLGTPFIVDKFFSRFRDDSQGHKGILPFLLFLPFVGGTLFALLYWLCKDVIHAYFEKQSPMILEYHFLVIPLTFFWVYISVLESYCRNNSRTAIPNFIREVYLRAANMLLILIFGLGWINFKVMMYLVVGAYGFAVVALIFYIRKLGKWYWTMPDRTILTKETFKTMLGYGGFTLLGGIGVNLMLFIDRSMLAGERGLVQTGIFIVAAYIAGVIEIPRKAIAQISIPLISTSLVNEDYEHLRIMNQKSALNQLLVGGLFFLLIWVSIDDIFHLIPKGETYGEGKYVVLFLALVKVIDIGTGLNTEIILYSKYYRYATYFIISSAVIGVLLNMWLIPMYGFIGAAIATTITTLIYSMMKMVFVWLKFQILPFTEETTKIVLILACLYLVSLLWPTYEHSVFTSMLMLFLRSVVISLAFAYLILHFKVSEEINNLAIVLWNKVSKRKTAE
jgi:O-antigen/teichoic acid export membrane protein